MSELNKLQNKFNELIDGLIDGAKDDLQEAEDNVAVLYEMIEGDDDQRMLYGNMYHEALKIKGQVRTRTLQIGTLLKDRITKIENDDLKKGKDDKKGNEDIVIDHRSMSEMLKENKKNGNLKLKRNDDVNHNVEENKYSETMEFDPKAKTNEDE